MLNEKDLESILGTKTPPLNIKDIHWKSQDSNRESILFYKIGEDEKSSKLFTERIQNSQYAWIVINKDHPSRPLNCSIIPENDWPKVQKKILDILYPMPNLKMLAVTGTNGKTTTADLVLQLAEMYGKKGMSIGTLGVRYNHKTILDFGLTSPSFIDLRKYLHLYGRDKDFCVLEASSHALVQQRIYGLYFDTVGWLSFSQDHLDYHKTMDDYFSAKLLLLNYLNPGSKLFVPDNQDQLFYKIQKVTDKVFKAKKIHQKLPLFCSTAFNRNNLEVAVAMVEATFPISITSGLENIVAPDGRFYIRPSGSSYIVVDFAHTPDALENICRGIIASFPIHKLTVLFGCGGDRDKTKRPVMGKIAESYAQKVYVTSDNPRSEDPSQIIDDIIAGMSSKKYEKIIERPKAVWEAMNHLGENEILLLAGKGHEDYILINGVKNHYSDIEEVEKFIARKS